MIEANYVVGDRKVIRCGSIRVGKELSTNLIEKEQSWYLASKIGSAEVSDGIGQVSCFLPSARILIIVFTYSQFAYLPFLDFSRVNNIRFLDIPRLTILDVSSNLPAGHIFSSQIKIACQTEILHSSSVVLLKLFSKFYKICVYLQIFFLVQLCNFFCKIPDIIVGNQTILTHSNIQSQLLFSVLDIKFFQTSDVFTNTQTYTYTFLLKSSSSLLYVAKCF